jgi:hypothetical protein
MILRWEGHVACIEDMRKAYKILLDNLKGRDHLEDIGMDAKMILEWIIKRVGRCGRDAFFFRTLLHIVMLCYKNIL